MTAPKLTEAQRECLEKTAATGVNGERTHVAAHGVALMFEERINDLYRTREHPEMDDIDEDRLIEIIRDLIAFLKSRGM